MAGPDRGKALEIALAQIDKQFGKGSVMRLGDEERVPVSVIPTGSIALDAALGIGGLPRGRVVEIFGPESSGKTTVALHSVASAQANGGIAAFIDAEHALDPEYAKVLGVDTDALLVSQPDTGEQALEIADMLIRSGALDILVIDSVAALVPRAEIEGEMGDSHVGLQARLMSQALRKLTGALHNANTTAVFINQLREKVGVMFGCFDYSAQVTLADGTQEKIGKIVDQRMDVEVLTYDSHTEKIAARPITNWFNNGATNKFLRFTVEGVSGDSDSQFSVTENHLIRTPGGWREAGELLVEDRVLSAGWRRLSDQQHQLVLGSLLGDGELSAADHKQGAVQFRWGSSAQDPEYLIWKQSLLSNVAASASGVTAGLALLPELSELQAAVYLGDGKKYLSREYVKSLTPLSLAIWYMDKGELTAGAEGNGDEIGQVAIDARTLSEGSRARLMEYLRDSYGLKAHVHYEKASSAAAIQFDASSSEKFQELIAPFIHSTMAHTLAPRFRGDCVVKPVFIDPERCMMPARVLDIQDSPRVTPEDRFDIEVEGTHNYFVDGVMVHNSPETTTGGRALKFYSSIRLDVRRIETLKDGSEAVANRTRVKVVKNKVAPPFKQAEFDIVYGHGISREGSLIDVGVEHGIVRKSGAWYTYEGDQLGQGKENVRNFLRDNPDLANEIEKKVKEKLGIGATVDAADAAVTPADF